LVVSDVAQGLLQPNLKCNPSYEGTPNKKCIGGSPDEVPRKDYGNIGSQFCVARPTPTNYFPKIPVIAASL
jgi:hypothetical protein